LRGENEGALPLAPLKKLFEKMFLKMLRIFWNLQKLLIKRFLGRFERNDEGFCPLMILKNF